MKAGKKNFIFLFIFIALVSLNANAQKYVGGDISCLPIYESAGTRYLTHSGSAISSPLTFFKDEGMNAMRVRLFVDPKKKTTEKNSSGVFQETDDSNVCQDLAWVKKLGKRIKDAGFSFLLDFHYSDTWADPAKQWNPSAWENLSDSELNTKIYEYTKDVLTQLKEAGATPDLIQIGNEISYGMLWGKYSGSSSTWKTCYTSSNNNWTYFTDLLKNASKACREICPDAKIIIHTERAAQPSVLKGFYDKMKSNNVDYDIVGLSYYSYYHGALSVLETAISTIESNFADKKIMIVETGYPLKWAVSGTTYNYTSTYPYSDAGQKSFTSDLITLLNKHSNVNGLFWWWMEYNAYGTSLSGWYNAPLFDSETGKATSALSVMKDFLVGASGLDSVTDSEKANSNAWYNLNGAPIAKPSQNGLYINGNKKVIITK